MPLTVTSIAPAGRLRLADPALAEPFGGSIPVIEERGDILAKEAQFEVTLSATGASPSAAARGVVHIAARPESFAGQLWRQVARVFVREQGF